MIDDLHYIRKKKHFDIAFAAAGLEIVSTMLLAPDYAPPGELVDMQIWCLRRVICLKEYWNTMWIDSD